MQIDDITSYLYSNEASKLISSVTGSKTAATSSTDSTDTTTSFSSLLSDEISNITDLAELSSVMSGSVLGNITDADSLQSLSEDLMGTSSGREVLTKLAEGHLNSIVLTDSDDDDDENSSSLTNTLSSYTQALSDTSSVSEVLDEITETLNTSASSVN